MDLFESLDWGTYYFFRFQANHAPALVPLMRAGAWLGSYVGVAIVLFAAVAMTSSLLRRRMVLVVVPAFLAGALLVEGVKVATRRPRPPDAQNILGVSDTSASFPSRAVFLAAFAYPVLAQGLERRASRAWQVVASYALATLIIVFVCVSQLWLGLHFVTDVLAGLAGGIALALSVRWRSGP